MFRDLLDLMTEESEKAEFPGIWRWERLEFLSVFTGGLVARTAERGALSWHQEGFNLVSGLSKAYCQLVWLEVLSLVEEEEQ